ncbi:MAG TPA: helix-turn-helix domain-containing protein [Candidatus Paceibacterota bacterium]|nr:helix-turn-helix domain-containing protein [Verrucomicrobiota bacterium]HRY51720.1 helix-turn-helix domain-containing protein [Candidatus Paceibacterota bacterium]
MNMTNEKPRWYSIKEAAEYLDVGEPTLYRWMRDGQITYRKVGDSTRFWKEDLDAVMQVFHSERDAEKTRLICPYCHHDEMIEGHAQSTGLVYFRPIKTKFWTLKEANVDTRAFMCSRCGGITWFGNVEKLKQLRQSTKTGEEKPPSVQTKEVP